MRIDRELVLDTELAMKIADTKRQLNDPNISPCRKRDLTKYLHRLCREEKQIRSEKDGRI